MATKKKKGKVAVRKVVQKTSMPAIRSSRPGIEPLGDRVLVLPIDPRDGEMTASGIIIPDTVSKEKPQQGTVVAVGEGKWNEDGDERIPMTVKPGQKVLFSKYGPDEIEINGVEYMIISESSILAILN